MADIIIVCILVICVGGASYYIYKNKKKGGQCIGCPCAQSCSGKCGSGNAKQDVAAGTK